MDNKLKKFITEHRYEFDTKEPPEDLFEKIDAKMEIKKATKISSNWLSKFKYLGFGASLLVLLLYFFANNFDTSTRKDLAANKRDTIYSNSKQLIIKSIDSSHLNLKQTSISKDIQGFSRSENETQNGIPVSLNNKEKSERSTLDILLNQKADSVLSAKSFEIPDSDQKKFKAETSSQPLTEEVEKTNTNYSASEKKETNLTRNPKKTKLYIPEAPEKMNTYSATLYDGSSFRSLLRAYKFPGKFSIYNDGDITTIKTISCSRLEKTPTIKAVWLKGRTDKEIELSIKNGFKNIFLLKSDGRKLKPEAISHYYRGLGVISDYKGRYFNLLFTDKVELILFFVDAQEGDKVIIDSSIEAVIVTQP